MDEERNVEVQPNLEEVSPHLPENIARWNIPRPEILPRPTYAPAGVAFGAVFLLWGILTSPIVSVVGLIIFIISLAAWIGEILHERG